jgi:Fe-Mn family superoxide dismutase
MVVGHASAEPVHAPTYPFALPPLRFAYDALEPYFDERTMRLHHDKHHRAYVDGLNAAIKDTPALHGQSIETILRQLDKVPQEIRTAVRNHGGGHANHQFFWKVIGPPGTLPTGELLQSIEADFGSLASFKTRFTEVAVKHFASGWTFLMMDPKSQRLKVMALPNHDSVLGVGKMGLLICDVWEHAYYLKYENRRAEFLAAFWNVVDWDVVGARLAAFRGHGPLA